MNCTLKTNSFSRNLCEKSKGQISIENSEKACQVKTLKEHLPEEPTSCCMSGCANCVWLEYAESLSEYYKDGGEKAIEEINQRVSDSNIKAFLLHELRMRNKK